MDLRRLRVFRGWGLAWVLGWLIWGVMAVWLHPPVVSDEVRTRLMVTSLVLESVGLVGIVSNWKRDLRKPE